MGAHKYVKNADMLLAKKHTSLGLTIPKPEVTEYR